MKKILVTMMSALALCSLVILPTACGGKTGGGNGTSQYDDGETFVASDTFKGALSETSYESETNAVKGFLATEISGEVVTATLQDVETKKELSKTEIAALETEDVLEEDDEIVSAKEVEVKYTRTKSSVRPTAAAPAPEDDYFVFTVYILEISPHGSTVHVYRYYVPKAERGDVLTRSYYDDVLDTSKYTNCTQEYTNDFLMPTMSPTSMSITEAKGQNSYSIKVADNKAFIKMHVYDSANWEGAGEIPYSDILGYFEEQDGNFSVWMSTTGENGYVKSPFNPFMSYGITDMASFATLCLPKIDYSYYEKTSYGFKVQEDFLNEYLGKALNQAISAGASVSAELKVYVQDGRIVQLKASNKVTMAAGGITVTISSQESLVFKDFGTTVVTKPATITD